MSGTKSLHFITPSEDRRSVFANFLARLLDGFGRRVEEARVQLSLVNGKELVENERQKFTLLTVGPELHDLGPLHRSDRDHSLQREHWIGTGLKIGKTSALNA